LLKLIKDQGSKAIKYFYFEIDKLVGMAKSKEMPQGDSGTGFQPVIGVAPFLSFSSSSLGTHFWRQAPLARASLPLG
jgi:hypothetical protein